jgi:hypothetical protein
MKVAMLVMIVKTMKIEQMVTIKFLVTSMRTIVANARAIPIPYTALVKKAYSVGIPAHIMLA